MPEMSDRFVTRDKGWSHRIARPIANRLPERTRRQTYVERDVPAVRREGELGG